MALAFSSALRSLWTVWILADPSSPGFMLKMVSSASPKA